VAGTDGASAGNGAPDATPHGRGCSMRIVLTGATGFIGRNLAHQLIDRGDEVVAIVRDPSKAADLAERGAVLIEGDITDRDSMRPAFDGSEALFHLAAWYEVGIDDTQAMERINVEGTRHVLELMREYELAKGVYTSSLAVNSDTHGELVDETYRHDPADGFLSSYDRTKWQAHYEVALPMIENGLPLVIVQPGLVYGPGDTSQFGEALRRYLQRDLPLIVRGVQYAWGYIDDIVRAHVLALDRGAVGETYLTCGPVHGWAEAMELAEELTGIPAPRLRLPAWLVGSLAQVSKVVHGVIPIQGDFHPETLAVVAGVTYIGDNSKAKEALNWNPRPLEDGLALTLAAEMRELGMDVPERLRERLDHAD
jgi:nucleoside-diphosphate-sugar epimerase